jgi:hypothetical protein
MGALTKERSRRIIQAIQECDRFIGKEGPRDADLRPAAAAQHLEFCIKHKAKLQAMLANDSDTFPAAV